MARYSKGDQFDIAHLKRNCLICGRYTPPVGRARRAIGLKDVKTTTGVHVRITRSAGVYASSKQVRILTLDDKYMYSGISLDWTQSLP